MAEEAGGLTCRYGLDSVLINRRSRCPQVAAYEATGRGAGAEAAVSGIGEGGEDAVVGFFHGRVGQTDQNEFTVA
jgi:hypothetical protein